MSCGCSGVSPSEGSSCGCQASAVSSSLCPKCGSHGRAVSAVTIKSQLQKDALALLDGDLDDFGFCENPSCDTVYYRQKDGKTFGQKEINSRVTLKNDDPNTPLCYCKKLLKKDFYEMLERGETDIAAKIKAVIASGKSFCEKSNPKGVCCTEDVKIFLKSHDIEWDDGEAKTGCC